MTHCHMRQSELFLNKSIEPVDITDRQAENRRAIRKNDFHKAAWYGDFNHAVMAN